MSQAANNLTRRGVIMNMAISPLAIGTGALAFETTELVQTSSASEERLIDLEGQFEKACRFLPVACDALAKSEAVMAEWLRRNPKPVMRAFTVPEGSMGSDEWLCALDEATTEAERNALRLINPNRDMYAAASEHSEALRQWKARYETAEAQAGADRARSIKSDAEKRVLALVDDICTTRATTSAGIFCKARMALIGDLGETSISLSLVDDLNDMPQNAECPIFDVA